MQKFALILSLLVSLAVMPVQALTINLIPSANPVTVGETFTLDVTITNLLAGRAPADAVIAFGFNISIDDPIIALLSATLAAPFDALTLPDTEVAGLAFPTGAQNSPLTLATLTLQALNPGTTNVGIVSDILTYENHGLFFALDLTPEPVDITAAIAITVNIPEPASVLLLGTGLLGLLAYRWRRAVKA